jgi:CheY-like chemotaxis protein
MLTLIYLFCSLFVVLPCLSMLSENALFDFPIYFVSGIVITVLLLRGKWAWLFLAGELAVDFLCLQRMAAEMTSTMQTQGKLQYDSVLYYRIISAILVTGVFMGSLLSYRNKMLQQEIRKCAEMEKKAEQTNYAKDMFLVNVSHEIRTPLNAILGTTELLFDLEQADDRVKENAFSISKASKALLFITNDLMNFSKIDYDNIQLNNDGYYIAEMLDDLINVLTIRFVDNKIELYTYIDKDIPAKLYGDSTKLEQILLTMMSGVVQTMESGMVILAIEANPMEERQLALAVEIRASGAFQCSFQQLLQTDHAQDGSRNLGYSKLVYLIEAMQGSLSVEENGWERKYRFRIVQECERRTPLISEDFRENNILFFENSEMEGNVLARVLKDMNIRFTQVTKNDAFYEECVKDCYTHVLLAAERYDGIKERAGELMPPQSLILISPTLFYCEDSLIKTTFARPVSCLSVDALLSDKKSNAIWHTIYHGGFLCPDAKIMVVDDNMINLEVASGILKKYQAQVVLATSGKECLCYLEENHVDFIFLDYMMPEMDGIDTLKNIRALHDKTGEKVPVVALTANAVSGAREMFLSAGFDEYISKPIELEKFERVLRELLDKDKIIFLADHEEAL